MKLLVTRPIEDAQPLAEKLEGLGHDAVMVGSGTARADDPNLTARDLGATHQPVRVLIDTRAATDPAGQLGRTAREVPVWLCHGPDAPANALAVWAAQGARLFECDMQAGRVDVVSALRALAGAGLTRVLCEGGGQLAASLLRADLVGEVVAFGAGLVIGEEGRAAIGTMDVTHLGEAPRFILAGSQVVGGDVMTRWLRA